MVGVDERGSISGSQVGRYWVEDLIGRGGMGEVYRGYDPTLQRRIVVKRLHPEADPNLERSRRLQREAQLHGQLTHPHVVRVYDFVGSTEGDCIISELIEGENLRERASRQRPPLATAFTWLIEIAAAMDYSHSRGIIHRDLKLENALVTSDGHIKVTDFGLSRSAGPSDPLDEGVEGSMGGLGGTLICMAPEQLWGRRGDARSDMFSFGVMAFELLSGRHPFQGRTPAETCRNLLDSQHAPLKAVSVMVPAPVSELVDRLLAKSPDGRPTNFAEVVRVLEGFKASVAAVTGTSIEHRQVAVVHLILGADPRSEQLSAEFQGAARAALRAIDAQLVAGVDHEITACVGFPAAHERSACVAAELAAQLSASAPLGAGLVLGSVGVIVGEQGPTFVGETFGLARRLAESAGPGRLLADARSRSQLVAGGFSVVTREQGYEIGAPTHDPPIDPVGREALLARIVADLDAVLAAQSGPTPRTQLLWVEGEAGIGKTTLVRAAAHRAARHSAQRVSVALNENDRYVPFSVARRLLLTALGADPHELRLAITTTATDPIAAAATAQVAGVADAADLALLTPAADGRLPRELAAHAARYLASRLSPSPTLLVVEDLHWADSGSLAFLEHLAAYVGGRPLALILTARPETSVPWAEGPGRRRVVLGRLTPVDGRTILDRIPGAGTLAPEILESILERADGVPLWIEELTQVVLSGSSDGRSSTHDGAVPASLRDAVQYRLQLVGARTRRVAELAATIGGVVSTRLLQAAAVISPAELTADLTMLENRGLIRTHGLLQRTEVSFRHALMESAVYADAEPRRHDLHGAICTSLESGALGGLSSQPALSAHHYQLAGRTREATHWWSVAAARAAERSAHDLASAHYRRALELLPSVEEGTRRSAEERRLRSSLGLSLMVVHGIGSRQVEQNNAQLLRLTDAGASPDTWVAMYVNWAVAYVTANLQAMTAWTGLIQDRADALTTELEPERAAYEYLLTTMRGLLQYHVGELDDAIVTFADAERIRPAAIAHFSVLPDKSQLIIPGTYAAMCHALLGEPELARAAVHREERAWPDGSPERFTAQTVGALTFAFLREYDEVRRLTTSVIAAPAGLLNPTHVAFSRTLLQLAEIERIRRDPRSDFVEEAARVIDGLWAYMLACAETGLVIGVLLQQALCAEGVLEVASHHRTTPPLRRRALDVATAILERGVADLARPDVETLNRHIAPDFHRVRARLAILEADPAAAHSALESAQAALELVRRATGREPSLLATRCRAMREEVSS